MLHNALQHGRTLSKLLSLLMQQALCSGTFLLILSDKLACRSCLLVVIDPYPRHGYAPVAGTGLVPVNGALIKQVTYRLGFIIGNLSKPKYQYSHGVMDRCTKGSP